MDEDGVLVERGGQCLPFFAALVTVSMLVFNRMSEEEEGSSINALKRVAGRRVRGKGFEIFARQCAADGDVNGGSVAHGLGPFAWV